MTFDTREAIAEEVKKVTKAQILNLYRTAVLEQQWSWLLFEKGEPVKELTPLNSLDRDALERFPAPTIQDSSQPADSETSQPDAQS
jgi:hypothetical protein